MGLQLLPPTRRTWFNLPEKPIYTWYVGADEFPGAMIRIDLSRTKHMIRREVFSPLDFLGDVGGVFDGLCLVGSIIISVWNYFTGRVFDEFLLERDFKKSATDRVKYTKKNASI